MTYRYYHHPNCSKSREGLRILNAQNIHFTIRLYMTDLLTRDELEDVVAAYKGPIKDLIREAECRDHNLDISLVDQDDLITAVMRDPAILQRPLLYTPSTLIIGRPPSRFKDLGVGRI